MCGMERHPGIAHVDFQLDIGVVVDFRTAFSCSTNTVQNLKYFDVKRKKVYYKTVIECGKRCQNIFIGLKKTCLGILDKRKT